MPGWDPSSGAATKAGWSTLAAGATGNGVACGSGTTGVGMTGGADGAWVYAGGAT